MLARLYALPLLILPSCLLSCGSSDGAPGAEGSSSSSGRDGTAGQDGADGTDGEPCVVEQQGTDSVLVCPDGSSHVLPSDGGAGGGGDVFEPLRVYANGTQIGELQSPLAGPGPLYVFQRDTGILFYLNHETGFLAGETFFYFTTSDCSGSRYVATQAHYCSPTSDSALPLYSRIYAVGNPGGWELATTVLEESTWSTTTMQSFESNGTCVDFSSASTEHCASQLVANTTFPKSFPTPITVE